MAAPPPRDRPPPPNSAEQIIIMMDTIGRSEFATVTYGDFRRLRVDWSTELVVRRSDARPLGGGGRRCLDPHGRPPLARGRAGLGCRGSRRQTIFEHLNVRETAISAAERDLSAWERQLQQREELLEQSLTADLASWYKLKAATDEVLGVGLQITRGGPGARDDTQITSVLVSHEYVTLSWFLRSRGQPLLDSTFQLDYWVPLFLRPEHGRRATQLMKQTLAAVVLGVQGTRSGLHANGPSSAVKASAAHPVGGDNSGIANDAGDEDRDDASRPNGSDSWDEGLQFMFLPAMAPAMLAILMNSMVVNMVRERMAVDAALDFYVVCYRWLIYFVQTASARRIRLHAAASRMQC